MVSPVSTVDQTAVETPVPTVTTTNPLAKLISTMLPNVTAFVPSSNGTTNRPVSPAPLSTSTMNNDAAPFVPSQQQHGSNQQHLNNANMTHWNNAGARGGSGNRRGQSGVRLHSFEKQTSFAVLTRVVVFIMVVVVEEETNDLQVICSTSSLSIRILLFFFAL